MNVINLIVDYLINGEHRNKPVQIRSDYKLSGLEVVEMVQKELPEGSRIVTIGQIQGRYTLQELDQEVFINDPGASPSCIYVDLYLMAEELKQEGIL